MSFSDWRKFIAIGGCLAATLLPLSVSGQQNKKTAESRSCEQASCKAPPPVTPETLRSLFQDAVKAYADEKASNQAAEERKERREISDLKAQEAMADWNWWLVILGVGQAFLAAVTIGLLGAAYRESWRTAEAGIKAADAAADSVKALQNAERGYIQPHVAHSIFATTISGYRACKKRGEPPSSRGYEEPNALFSFHNYGRTPSFLVEYRRRIEVSATCPDKLDASEIGELPVETALIGDERSERLTFRSAERISPEDMEMIIVGTKYLWLVFEVTYDDAFGNRHDRSFRFRFDVKSAKFQPYGQT